MDPIELAADAHRFFFFWLKGLLPIPFEGTRNEVLHLLARFDLGSH